MEGQQGFALAQFEKRFLIFSEMRNNEEFIEKLKDDIKKGLDNADNENVSELMWKCVIFFLLFKNDKNSELVSDIGKLNYLEKCNSSVKIPVISMEDVPKIMEEMEK